ncbi:MAG TPA: growth inhibitor PemK [Lachnospiraceae bacterium]|nr:growth inhibitor PemK [Lachnospiraceae bacterium]
MMEAVKQGDILKIDGIKKPVLTVSKDFFNKQGEIIGCPIFTSGEEGPLHICIRTSKNEGYVQCEKLALLDLRIRHYAVVDSISEKDKINISDAIQGIFDYL